MKYLVITILFAVFVISCSGGEEEKDPYEIETTLTDYPETEEEEEVEEQKVFVAKPGAEHKEYHPNGQLKIEGQYDMDAKRTGLWISYYEDGTKWSESYYIKGQRDGHSITFFPNGNPRYVGEFKDDEKTGNWTFYDKEGNVVKEESY